MPKGRYSGQKLIKLVSINMPDKISNTMANVPEITLVKKSITTTAAISILIILSAKPMFFFIFSYFYLKYLLLSNPL